MPSIPTNIRNALLAGGVNLSFGFYVWDMTQDRNEHFADLPRMAALGIKHVRPVMGMNAIESGTSGKVDVARWNEVLRFIREAKANGIVTIVDNHTAGDQDWVDGDYMGELRKAAMRTRHKNLMVDIATRLQAETDLHEWVIFQIANEPIFSNSEADGQIWYNHQRNVIPAVRAAAPDIVLFVMAIDWQGVDETVNWLHQEIDDFLDAGMIVDCHFYEPMEVSHASSGGQYPATYSNWRGTNNWNNAFIRSLIEPLKGWRDSNNIPMVNISEFGTNKGIDRESRLRWISNLVSLFREFGFGYTLYTWGAQAGDRFDMRPDHTDPRIAAFAFTPGSTPPPDEEPPDDEEPPTDPPPSGEVLARLATAEANLTRLQSEFAAMQQLVETLRTQVLQQNARLAAAASALTT